MSENRAPSPATSPATSPVSSPDTRLVLRAALAQDMAACEAIYAHAVLHGNASFDERPPAPGHLAAKWAELAGSGYPFFVLAADGLVLGYAYAAPYRPRSAYRFTAEHSIYLAPEAQGRGAATTLFAALVQACEAMGLKTLVAVIGMTQAAELDASASYRAHVKAGFVLVGALPNVGFKFGKWCKTVLMTRELGSAPPATKGQLSADSS